MMSKKTQRPAFSLRNLLRVPTGEVRVTDLDPAATPGLGPSGKDDQPALLATLGTELSDLQERLFANGRESDQAPRILVVLQGMDTSGKGGVVRHTFGLVDPQGLQLKSFKAPTKEELEHDFLWRIRKELPRPGMIGIFDRSHYEDVLVVRVNELLPVDVWRERYDIINAFEKELVDAGTVVIKCFLNVSYDKQRERLLERLASPEKYWKYNPGDVDVRKQWGAYLEAYNDLLTRCNPDHAPWYAIPADRKWYRNWAIAQLLHEHLSEMQLGWPAADFDVAAEIKRVKQS